jgi:hypothetical protein
VEGWAKLEQDNPGKVVVSPEGMLADQLPGGSIVPRADDERIILARRLVAERCLYGVDKNHLAAEMAKLSLWLITLDRNRPFTFLDHHIRCGDTLLGVSSIAQLESFNLAAESDSWAKQNTLYIASFTKDVVKEAAAKVAEISALPVLEIADAERKERLYREVVQKTQEIRVIADLLVASSFETSQARGNAFIEHVSGYWNQLKALLEQSVTDERRQALIAELRMTAQHAVEKEAPASQKPRRMLHWPIAFPEVFEAGGFNAIIGNPPFVGGRKIRGAFGGDFFDYLTKIPFGESSGNADLCAFFFLRGAGLLQVGGTLGLLATNTIAQGDTRETGLTRLLEGQECVYRASPSVPWPGTAAVEVAHCWIYKGVWKGQCVLEGRSVPGITSYLARPGRSVGKPARLLENQGKSFQGSIVLGKGFVLEPEEALMLLKQNPSHRDVIFPYLNGEDINSRPDQSATRWVINFHDWPVERAREYAEVFRIVEERVKAERLSKSKEVAEAPWWLYWRARPELYSAIKRMKRVLVRAQISRKWIWVFVSTDQVLNQRLIIFPFDDFGHFGLFQSSVHFAWADTFGSTMKSDLSYASRDLFETFPIPESLHDIVASASDFYEKRQRACFSRNVGLTDLVNLINSPAEQSGDICQLRQLIKSLDQSVVDAYGWRDLTINHDFVAWRDEYRFMPSDEDRMEIVERLAELNVTRAQEQRRAQDANSLTSQVELF